MILTFLQAYEDKETGKWKIGKRGKPVYDTKILAERAAINMLTDRLRAIKDKLNSAMLGYGN